MTPTEHIEQTNPLHDATQEQLEAGRGLKPADMTPEERHLHKNKLQRGRASKHRKGQVLKEEAEGKERTTTLSQAQVKDALDVTALLAAKIDLVAARRAQKASRLLGTVAEDATFETFSKVNRSIAGAIARDERSKEDLLVAAEYLSNEPGIPSVHWRDEPPEHASWLMSVIEYRSRTAIQDWYDHKEPTIESLAYGDSVIASTHSDDYYDRFCADRQLGIMGARFVRPGAIDPAIVQGIIMGAITERGLDALVELILSNLRSDGYFPWSKHAEDVFLALGLETHWHLLCSKANSPELAGRYARGVARRALAFVLPVMSQATAMLESGYWTPPDPTKIQFTIAPEPDAEARTIIKALEDITEALA